LTQTCLLALEVVAEPLDAAAEGAQRFEARTPGLRFVRRFADLLTAPGLITHISRGPKTSEGPPEDPRSLHMTHSEKEPPEPSDLRLFAA
jgi:hypothetical protein